MEKQAWTLEKLAEKTSAKLVGNPQHLINDVADLQSAGQQDAAFLANPRYAQAMRKINRWRHLC